MDMAEEAFIRFTQIAAYGIPDADNGAGEGSSDPYVKFIIHCDGRRYRGRTKTMMNADRNVLWEDACQISIPPDLPLETSTLEVQASEPRAFPRARSHAQRLWTNHYFPQVWDQDDDDQLMGKIPKVARDGHTHLELDEAYFEQLDIQGHGKLYAFKVSFLYECYIPGVSPCLPRSLISTQAYKRGPIRMKTLAKSAHQFGRAGAVTMHPLPFRPVRLTTASGSADGSFDAYVYINDVCGNRRAAERLAVVTLPPMEAVRGPASEREDPALRAATIPLHHRLVERGWNVLAYEANALSDDGCGEAELAKLRAAMAYCSQHKLLRYCRVSLVTQGTGASAALMAMHDYPQELNDRVRVISACEPAVRRVAFAHTYTHTCIHACTHACMHAHIHTCIHTCEPAVRLR